jgi:predicted ATP-dependent protease
VLPVGGIKERVVAAAAAGLTRVMLPARNRRDFDEIPLDARSRLEFVWLERFNDAIAAALERAAVHHRIELVSKKGTKGEFRFLLCNHILEVFDGSTEVALRLTV